MRPFVSNGEMRQGRSIAMSVPIWTWVQTYPARYRGSNTSVLTFTKLPIWGIGPCNLEPVSSGDWHRGSTRSPGLTDLRRRQGHILTRLVRYPAT
ncbi:Cytochrome c oxidase copper chaperone [Fusarium oxysporum f. sp. albedinis]|nr:Cytochrome c oxidase copper chaperone [Fusarium oxysporum f. sp. albedinis]